jgi:Family of unknown function (DUF5683)
LKTLIEFWKYWACRGLLKGGLLLCCLFFLAKSNAQYDSLHAASDSIQMEKETPGDTAKIRRLDPRKALFYSAAFPGLGQMYNNKYWKLPLVYGGFAVTITVVNFYQRNYVKYRDELYTFIATQKLPVGRTEQNLRYVVDKARRERDYYVIITGIWYLLQIVDAHVDAHLQEFKWNKEMKISLRPSVEQNMMIGRTAGLSLTFKF